MPLEREKENVEWDKASKDLMKNIKIANLKIG